ncbi:SMC family ATPase [Nocardioides sp. C4-1]|uniref:SMC family ATPase n=1 Tax=Nocardioides sp. C4-1 TaxID=3151851 RepID=UPI0032636FD1
MRLHHLRVEAFGPFATSAEVDFDELSEAGLFLLSGATGAGKTSVLDAVCFALYGDVPGDRGSAKRLRSDHAAPHTVPRVTLEVTLSGRRFRVVRSPAWRRPKRRGEGTTAQQAGVTLSELVDDSWTPLSSRLDETGDLLGRLLGLSLTQFTQVALLPQGRFQAFLRARSDERHRLLQQLFHTGRFERVEQWLAERRRDLGREHAVVRAEVDDVVSRASEAAGVPAPDHGDGEVEHDDLTAWLARLVADAEAETSTSGAAVGHAAERERISRAGLQQARVVADRAARTRAAAAELDELEATAAVHHDDRRRLDAARRAAAVRPLHTVAVNANATAVRAREHAAHAFDLARRHLGDHLRPETLDDAEDHAAAVLADVRSFRPRGLRLEQARVERREVERGLEAATVALAQAQAAQRDHPALLAASRERLAAAGREAERAVALDERVSQRRAALAAHDELAGLEVTAAEARTAYLDARESCLGLRERLVTIQHARVDGMAAELATALAVGACCPVCGSADHPDKAHPAPGAPDAAAEKAARAEVDTAASLEHAHSEHLRELEIRVAAVRERTGDLGRAETATALTQADSALRRARGQGSALPGLEHDVAALEAAAVRLEADVDDAERHCAALELRHGVLVDEVATLDAELQALLGDHDDLDELVRHHERTRELCATAATRARDAAAAAAAADDARAALLDAADDAGFADVHEAVAAALDRSGLDALSAKVAHHEARLAAVRAVLADVDVPLDDGPSVAELEVAHGRALAALADAETRARVSATRLTRLAGLRSELADVLERAVPLRAELDLTTSLAAFVEGRSPGNRLRMRLSAYVLAYRLSQVVAAANERLARMSDQRYSLEHTGHRGAGETRGGLSLLVHDDWSGDTRDPATLSGGETFVVSLALALGLADVIAHEAGGASLDTLFVDEGFGSLDADTLDDVLDVLDDLRDGGRVVGVVSHVAEMRDRIPTQLVVTKSRQGSAVSVRR